ncbi:FlaD/FlaE family flagellar protein [Thermococcus camini]|uniref:Flagella protein FlaD-like protein n=1 Tax=Thermococcus camini TaxID=2016373 RepID=A0A7G2DA97_9EURY|nr:FlaD/FlaE family flagellar protein [Thermococcus camini]CAD5244571.1 Flagella protein FlaD-like protein [Thermococcus camini]
MITEIEIDEKLKRLRGKVPNFLVDDLKERLMKKRDILTPEQVDKIVDRVLQTYAGQLERISKLDSRVDEIGRYLEEIRNHLAGLSSNPGNQRTFGEVSQGSGEAFETNGAGIATKISEESPIRESAGDVSMSLNTATPGTVEVMPMERGFEIPPDIRDVLISAPSTPARLERIPNDMVSTMMALKWLGFLIDRVGMQNLENVLEFYYSIGWISEGVLNTLLRYAAGIRPHHREPDWRPDERLTIQDHLVSLLFIERLRGVRITREVLDAVEREMRLIGKVLDDMYGV